MIERSFGVADGVGAALGWTLAALLGAWLLLLLVESRGRKVSAAVVLSGALTALLVAAAVLRPTRVTTRGTELFPKVVVLQDRSWRLGLKEGERTRDAIASTLVVLRDQLSELIRFQSLLVMFLQQITPYVDTRDRDVAGLLRGLSGSINAVADELMKKTEAMLSRDRRHEARVAEVESAVTALRQQIADARQVLEKVGGSR